MRARLLTVAVAALVGALTALAAVAGADFVDTSNSPFATEIENVADAGCASGFAGNTFRPRDAVTRQQFAAWMNRCGGRVGFDHGGQRVLDADAEDQVAVVDMTPGAISGGGGFMMVIATMDARDSTSPGDVTFRLRTGGVATPLDTLRLTVADTSVSGTLTAVVPVDGGANRAFELSAQRASGVPVAADGALTVLYVPFASDGTGGGAE